MEAWEVCEVYENVKIYQTIISFVMVPGVIVTKLLDFSRLLFDRSLHFHRLRKAEFITC